MSQSGGDQQEQSVKEFLLSKEGRSVLIGSIVVIIVFTVMMFWVYGKVFGSEGEERTRAEDLASEGQGRTRAQTRELQGDPTSQNLTEEAQGVVREYNMAAATDERLHPIPTFADVEEIPVLPVDPEAQEQEAPVAEEDTGPPTFEYEPPALPSNSQQPQAQQRNVGLTQEQVERIQEYQQRRMDAARSLVELYNPPPSNGSVSFSRPDRESSSEDTPTQGAQVRPEPPAQTAQAQQYPSQGLQCETPLVKAGEIRYANNDIALNTDFKGPLKMTFLDGKLRGWQGMGTFELNEFGARMKAQINTLISPQGNQVDANGYVLDPETTLWAVASDVDRHIIYRYGGFGLGTILSAFSEIADAREKESEVIRGDGTSSTQYREPDGKQITFRVLGEFSRLWEEAFRDNINRPITVTLDPNTQVGILFEDTICEPQGATRQRQLERARAGGRSDPVVQSF